MKVVHITPTYFDKDSIVGGGERYPTELASYMAEAVDTTLVSFAAKRRSYLLGKLKIELYPVKYFIHGNHINPCSLQYLISIIKSDIVHIHHINTLISDLGCLTAGLLGKRVFVTDYGGGGDLVINRKVPVFRFYENAIIYSQFSYEYIPEELKSKIILIKGGIGFEKFYPNPSLSKEKKILYVGRILPHKGINYLLEALQLLGCPDYRLTIIGKVYNSEFYQHLQQLASGLPVEFVHDADDSRLLHEYQTAIATVLPSVHTDCYGNYTLVPELMGFTLLESQACGTPVICTDAGAMHEFVDHGQTGFVVKQNSAEAIAEALRKILSLSSLQYEEYQARAHQWVKTLSWHTVVQKHLAIYQEDDNR